MSANLTQVAGRIRSAFPDVPHFDQIRQVAEGFGSRVYLLDEAYVFRVAKNAIVGRRYEKEWRLLPDLQARLPLAIPQPSWFSKDAFEFGTIGYPVIIGVPLTLDKGTKIDARSIAHDLARFMLALHAVPVSRHQPELANGDEEELEDLRDKVFPALRELILPEHFERLTRWCRSYLSIDSGNRVVAVIHGDPWPENLVLNDSLDELVGVIDFETLTVGDIAKDFAALTYLGNEFVDSVTAQYSRLGGIVGDGFHKRIRDELVVRELRGLSYALKYPEENETRDAVRKVRSLLDPSGGRVADGYS